MSDEKGHIPFNEDPGDFGLPPDYFSRSAASIANKIEWEEEHRAFSNLQALKNKSGFIVPESYLNTLENRLELIVYPHLFELEKQAGFGVPENYFEALELKELSGVLSTRQNELEGFETLSSIKKQNSFTVDEHYFTINQARLYTLLKDEKGSRTISLFGIKLSYAVAALLVIAIGMWTYNYYFKTVEMQDCGTMACLDKTDLVKAKNLENMDEDELFELVDAKNLEKKLDQEDAGNTMKKLKDSSVNDAATDDLLDEL